MPDEQFVHKALTEQTKPHQPVVNVHASIRLLIDDTLATEIERPILNWHRPSDL